MSLKSRDLDENHLPSLDMGLIVDDVITGFDVGS